MNIFSKKSPTYNNKPLNYESYIHHHNNKIINLKYCQELSNLCQSLEMSFILNLYEMGLDFGNNNLFFILMLINVN